ncbi:hypothetical protein FOYG_12014 [Fusarium oxysporum NRRL 32931]|uniref:Uncharacterized protein n=1 Tax=Fusarium oxysporum NRRL 32931 TaxID=660029 RepID=W9HPN3_FUSOX|nr:hypothetical protein FOYG_12014 [Fusarium oxysporum NRRL 32931]
MPSRKRYMFISSDVDAKPFGFTNTDFVTPLYHHKTEQWSIICVCFQHQSKENRGRPIVKAQHYDPDPRQDKGRHAEVGDRIRSWVERGHGRNVELKYRGTDRIAPERNRHLGALDFGARRSIRSKDNFWSGDPVKTIKGALQATQSQYPTPGITPGRRGSSISSAVNGAEGMKTFARTPKNDTRNGWELPTCDRQDIFGTRTPKAGSSKRRHVDSANPMAFEVKGKLDEVTASISVLKLPLVTALQKEVDDRRNERNKHNMIVENKKEELGKCQNERASRANEHGIIVTELTKLGADIAADEKAANEELAEIPPPTRKFIFPMPNTLQDLYRERFEANIQPQRQRHEHLGAKKRTASDMLQSVEQVCTTRQEEVEQAENEMRVIEEGVKKAYMRKEFVAMMERHLKDHKAFRFEGDDWEKQFDKRGGKM